MGAIHNKLIPALTVAALAVVVLMPVGAVADDATGAVLDPIEAPGDPDRVPAIARDPGAVDESVPLTRAAARRRVETMSPTDWLASYGEVVVGRNGPTGATAR